MPSENVIVKVLDASGVPKDVGRNTGNVNLPVEVAAFVPGTSATSLGKAEDAAHASGDTGVMLLGVRNESAASLSDTQGDYSPIGVGRYGNVFTSLLFGNSVTDANSTGLFTGIDHAQASKLLAGVGLLYNDATYDRQRGNMNLSLLASASRTVTTASADQTNYNARGVHVVLDMTAVGTGSVTITIQGKDSVSGQYYTLLAGVAVTTNIVNVYRVFPGSTVTANVSANDIVPRTWRINVVANNANAATYSVAASLIL